MQSVNYTNKRGRVYTVKGKEAKLFTDTKAFRSWMDGINPQIEMDHLEIRDSFIVANGKKMLFATVFGVNATLNKKPISAYAFLRSDAVAILPVIKETGK